MKRLALNFLALFVLLTAACVDDTTLETAGAPGTESIENGGSAPSQPQAQPTTPDEEAGPTVGSGPIAPGDTGTDVDTDLPSGVCCTDEGCVPMTDADCADIDGGYVDTDQGQCCDADGVCGASDADTCHQSGGSYTPPVPGACGLDGACGEQSDVQCALTGGTFVAGADCADHDADGFADSVPAPDSCGVTGPVQCTLKGDTLSVVIAGGHTLQLVSNWTANAAKSSFTTKSTIDIVTPAGNIALPNVNSITVDCAPGFHVTGTLTGLPSFADVAGMANTFGTTVGTPSIALGFAYGNELEDMGAPLADCSPYFFLTVNDDVTLDIGGAANLYAVAGNSVIIAFNPFDPAFYAQFAGASLGKASANLVNKVGLGLSREGLMTWTSALPLWDGQNSLYDIWNNPTAAKKTQIQGHVYRNGKFSLIPVPKMPAQIKLDGDVIVDMGAYADASEAVLAGLLNGDLESVAAVIEQTTVSASAADVMSSVRIASNTKKLTVAIDILEFAIGKSSMVIADGAFTFAGTGFSPTAPLANADSKTLKALAAITFQAENQVHGYVDTDGWGIAIHGDFQAGPFALTDASVIIDSEDGLRIEGGDFEFDFASFIEQLSNLMDCTFDNGIDCDLMGVDVVLQGEVTDTAATMTAKVDAYGLAGVGFGATVGNDGTFTFTANAKVPVSPMQTVSGNLTLTQSSLLISGTMTQLGAGITLTGALNWDTGNFSLSGTGTMGLAGFNAMTMTATVTNTTITLTGSMNYGVGTTTMTGWLNYDGTYELTGTGEVAFLGYTFGSASLKLSDTTGLTLKADIGQDIPGLTGTLTGSIDTNGNVTASGNGKLVVDEYVLAFASLNLDSNGLAIEGTINVPGNVAQLKGKVHGNGNFYLSSTASVDLAYAGVNVEASLFLNRTGNNVLFSGYGVADVGGHTFSSDFTIKNLKLQNFSATATGSQTLEFATITNVVNTTCGYVYTACGVFADVCSDVTGWDSGCNAVCDVLKTCTNVTSSSAGSVTATVYYTIALSLDDTLSMSVSGSVNGKTFANANLSLNGSFNAPLPAPFNVSIDLW